MTTLVAWVGADQRGPASLNIVSDSRISKGVTGVQTWDYGRKTFASRTTSDIFGYVDDVLFPSIMLGQIVNMLDSGCLYSNDTPASERFDIIFKHIEYSFNAYSDAMKHPFSIIHATREHEKMSSIFKLNVITAYKTKSSKPEWVIVQKALQVPNTSSSLIIEGSGVAIAKKWSERWDSSSQGNTSRAVFSGFCDAVFSGEDRFTYGAPQIVSLYRIGLGRTIGFVNDGLAYYSGAEVLSVAKGDLTNIDWRNRLFERCDAEGHLLAGAQKHHAPKGLGAT
ncbi:hypothetical protein [Vibrio harveyi]